MTVVLLLAAVAVVAATVALASGRGGELSEPAAESHLPELPGGVDADLARLHLPRGLWGYHVAATDEVLNRLADALIERENQVAELEHRLAEANAPLLRKGLSASWLPEADRPEGRDPEEDREPWEQP